MPTSTTGSWKTRRSPTANDFRLGGCCPHGGTPGGGSRNRDHAYTLIELTVVIFLIGLMLALTMPKIQDAVLSDNLKTATRRMIGTVKTLQSRAIREHRAYKLYLDMEANRYWTEWEGMTDEQRSEAREKASGLPGGVRIQDVSRADGQHKSVGDTVIHFSKKGYMEPAVIQLVRGDASATIVLSPFLGVVESNDASATQTL